MSATAGAGLLRVKFKADDGTTVSQTSLPVTGGWVGHELVFTFTVASDVAPGTGYKMYMFVSPDIHANRVRIVVTRSRFLGPAVLTYICF